MSKFSLPKSHVSYTLAAPLQQKVNNWSAQSPIRYFDFQRIYTTGEIICFSSNIDFMKARLNLKVPFMTSNLAAGTYLLDELRSEAVANLVHEHNIYNAISFIQKGDDYTDSIIFATDRDNRHCSSYYFNNVDYLNSLVLESQELLALFLSDRSQMIQLPDYLKSPQQIQNSYYQKADVGVLSKNLLDKLSENEKICFYYSIKGMTQNDIAKALKVTRSTICSYLLRAMHKLNCQKRSDLMAVAWKLGLIEFNYLPEEI